MPEKAAGLEQPERVFVAVDVSNLWHSCRKEYGTSARIDFLSLRKLVPTLWAPKPIDQHLVAYVVSGHSEKKPESFANSLQGMGYEVRVRHMSRAKIDKTTTKPTRTDWDVGITIDALHHINDYDTFVLVSGDGDFGQLIDYLRFRGKRTKVLSFKSSTGRDLYSQAEEVIGLDRRVVYEQ